MAATAGSNQDLPNLHRVDGHLLLQHQYRHHRGPLHPVERRLRLPLHLVLVVPPDLLRRQLERALEALILERIPRRRQSKLVDLVGVLVMLSLLGPGLELRKFHREMFRKIGKMIFETFGVD